MLAYLDALHDSCLTMNLQKEGSGISRLQKPDKLFLENPNLMYALSASQIDIGNVRETFFANQLRYCHKINAVSYTHLTLPTNREVEISVVVVSLKKKTKNT